MTKLLPFSQLENKIPQIENYKKDWLSLAEKQEINKAKQMYFDVEKFVLQLSKENRKIFINYFLKELNKLFEWGLAPTDIEEFYTWFNKIKSKIKTISSYDLLLECNTFLSKQAVKKYQENLINLNKEIIKNPKLNPIQLIINNALNSIKWVDTSNEPLIFNLTLDKRWSFNDLEVKIINTKKLGYKFNIAVIPYQDSYLIKPIESSNTFTNLILQNIEIKQGKQIILIEWEMNSNLYKIYLFKNNFAILKINKDIYKKYLSLWENIKKFFSNIPIWKELYADKKNYNLKIYSALEKVKKKLKKQQKIQFKTEKNTKREKVAEKNYVIKNINLPKWKGKHREFITFKVKIPKKNLEFATLSPQERMKKVKEFLENNPQLLDMVINQLKWTTSYWINKKITFTKEYIQKNKHTLRKNLIELILFILFLESKANPIVRNQQWSSALGLWQWLTTNWWKDKWDTSSFQTSLNQIWKSYPQNISQFIKWFPTNKVDKYYTKLPIEFSWQDQIKILLLELGTDKKIVVKRKKEKQVKTLKEFLWLALTGNGWAKQKIYELFHHTKPNKKTKRLILNTAKRYFNKTNYVF